MKKLSNLFIIFACFISAMSLTSCLNDDDEGLSPDVVDAYMTNMAGLYYGNTSDPKYNNMLVFYNDTISGENKNDTIYGIQARFYRDSTFVISNIPCDILTKDFPEEYSGLKNAIDDISYSSITSRFTIYNADTKNISYAAYSITPEPLTFRNVTFNGETHDVHIVFWASSGAYVNSSVEAVELEFYPAAVYFDDNNTPEISLFSDLNDTEAMRTVRMFVRATR